MLVSFFNKVTPVKETPVQLLSCEFCKNFKDTFFYGTTLVAAADFELYDLVSNSNSTSFVKETYPNYIRI